jgi:hypothetical protein
VCTGVTAGDFGDGAGTFVYRIDNFEGWAKVGWTLLGNVSGIDGSGSIASASFLVQEAGSSPLDLERVELYGNTGNLLPVEVVGGSYNGPEADFAGGRSAYMKGRGMSSFVRAGESLTGHGRVCNEGLVPLEVRVQYELIRRDGRVSTFGSGQMYRSSAPPDEYLYVNEFTGDFPGWPEYGVAPFLDAPDDGNQIETGPHCSLYGLFGFDDIALGGRVVQNVVLEGYCNGPYDEGVDYDVYAYPLGGFAWLGSLYGTGSPAWVTPRWTADSVSMIVPEALTEEGLNAFSVIFHSYYSGAGNFIDALRLRIIFASVDPLSPLTMTIDPGMCNWTDVATFITTEDDMGFYRGTATCYYTFNGNNWIQGDTEKRIWAWVWKP